MPDLDGNFNFSEFNDLFAKSKPTLYIKMADIFSIHHLIASEINQICSPDDVLRDMIKEVGSAKTNEHELIGVGTSEIGLTLMPRLQETEGTCEYTYQEYS